MDPFDAVFLLSYLLNSMQRKKGYGSYICIHTREIVNKRSYTKPQRCASAWEEQCNPTSGQTLARARTEGSRAGALCVAIASLFLLVLTDGQLRKRSPSF